MGYFQYIVVIAVGLFIALGSFNRWRGNQEYISTATEARLVIKAQSERARDNCANTTTGGFQMPALITGGYLDYGPNPGVASVVTGITWDATDLGKGVLRTDASVPASESKRALALGQIYSNTNSVAAAGVVTVQIFTRINDSDFDVTGHRQFIESEYSTKCRN